jgi:hypothetical protein
MEPTKNTGTAAHVTSRPPGWCGGSVRATLWGMKHGHWLWGLLLATLVAAGCTRGEAPTGIEQDRFVETIVELRHAAMETRGDTAAYEVRKQQILQANQVTEAQLRDYVAYHGRDVEHMAEVWNEINTRLGERFQTTLH